MKRKAEQIGKHRVTNNDIMLGIDELMQGKQADIFYCDPPWGQGNIGYWQTINKRHTGEPTKDIKYEDFINQIFAVASKYAKNIILIEYGIRWRKDIIDMGKKYGLIHIGIADLQYRSGSRFLPSDLHVFAKTKVNIPQIYFDNLKNTSGMATLENAVLPLAVKGGIILDPCCGMGYTAKAGVKAGMTFYGNELNGKRLQKTIDFLKSKK